VCIIVEMVDVFVDEVVWIGDELSEWE